MERSFIEEMTASEDKETIDEVKNLSDSLKKGFIKRAHSGTGGKRIISTNHHIL